MKISERAVRNLERRAIDKLRRNPLLKALWRDLNIREGDEGLEAATIALTPSEIAAVYGLAQNPEERRLMRKLLSFAIRSTD